MIGQLWPDKELAHCHGIVKTKLPFFAPVMQTDNQLPFFVPIMQTDHQLPFFVPVMQIEDQLPFFVHVMQTDKLSLSASKLMISADESGRKSSLLS